MAPYFSWASGAASLIFPTIRHRSPSRLQHPWRPRQHRTPLSLGSAEAVLALRRATTRKRRRGATRSGTSLTTAPTSCRATSHGGRRPGTAGGMYWRTLTTGSSATRSCRCGTGATSPRAPPAGGTSRTSGRGAVGTGRSLWPLAGRPRRALWIRVGEASL